MKSDLTDLKKLTLEMLKNSDTQKVQEENEGPDPGRFMGMNDGTGN